MNAIAKSALNTLSFRVADSESIEAQHRQTLEISLETARIEITHFAAISEITDRTSDVEDFSRVLVHPFGLVIPQRASREAQNKSGRTAGKTRELKLGTTSLPMPKSGSMTCVICLTRAIRAPNGPVTPLKVKISVVHKPVKEKSNSARRLSFADNR